MANENEYAADLLRRWPNPAALLYHSFPGAVRRAKAMGMTSDEIRSACYLGLLKAAAKHDPAKGDLEDFAPYAMRRVVEDDLYRPQRDADRLGLRRVESTSQVFADDGCEHAVDVAAGTEPPEVTAERADIAEVVRTAVGTLPSSSRPLILALYGLDGQGPRTLKAVAAEHGIAPCTARGRVREAERLLRVAIPTTC